MKKPFVLSCDVDMCIFDLSDKWYDYLIERSEFKPELATIRGSYDFTEHFPDVPTKVAYAFWKPKKLYYSVEPEEGCVEFLKKFHEMGAHIVFTSHVEGNHAKSKYDRLKELFPFMSGFQATREKGFTRADIFIDDRLKYLKQHPDLGYHDTLLIQKKTPYGQDVCSVDFKPDFMLDSWTIDPKLVMDAYNYKNNLFRKAIRWGKQFVG